MKSTAGAEQTSWSLPADDAYQWPNYSRAMLKSCCWGQARCPSCQRHPRQKASPWTCRGAAVDDAGGASLAELLKGPARRNEIAPEKDQHGDRRGDRVSLRRRGLHDARRDEMLAINLPCQNRIGGAGARDVEFLNATFNLRKCDLRKIFRGSLGCVPSPTNNVIRDTGACPAVLATAWAGPPRARARNRRRL